MISQTIISNLRSTPNFLATAVYVKNSADSRYSKVSSIASLRAILAELFNCKKNKTISVARALGGTVGEVVGSWRGRVYFSQNTFLPFCHNYCQRSFYLKND